MKNRFASLARPMPEDHPRKISWVGASSLALGGSNQSIFLIGALVASQGEAAIWLLVLGLVLSYMAAPGWIELSCMFPNRVGGIAATCAEAFRPYNPILSNLTGVCYWWGWIPTCGLTAIFSADAIHQWYIPQVSTKVLATVLVLVFMGVNLLGLKWAVRLAVPIAAIAALLALGSSLIPVFAGSVDWHRAADFHLTVPFGGTYGKLTSAMAGLYLVGFAAPAFEAAACHIGEMRHPARDQPRAMWFAGAMASLYFVVMPIVWLGVFGPGPLQGDLATTLGPSFAPLLGGLAKSAAIWFIAFNMFAGTLQPMSGASRTLSQLSQDGLLPRSLGYRHPRTDAPVVAIGITALFSIAFLIAGDPTSVIAAANLTYLIGIALPSVAVWILRRNEPDRERPYRARSSSLRLGVMAAFVWLLSTMLGFEQFGLPIVIFGLLLAYSGSVAYWWRTSLDRRRAGVRGPRRSIHFKLTGALLTVLVLDTVGYLIAVNNVPRFDAPLVAGLKDIFVTVGLLTIAVGLVLPGLIANTTEQVVATADYLSDRVLAEMTDAIEAFSAGELERADFSFDVHPLSVRTQDEFSTLAESFNAMQDRIVRVSRALSHAVDQASQQRNELERAVEERTDELRTAYQGLKFAQEQRLDILHRLTSYIGTAGPRGRGARDVATVCAAVASSLGPVMRARETLVTLVTAEGELDEISVRWHHGSDVSECASAEAVRAAMRDSLASTQQLHLASETESLSSFLWGSVGGDATGYDAIISPFFAADGSPLGVLVVASDEPAHDWGDRSLIAFVATDVSHSIMNARLFEGQTRLVKQLQDLDRSKDDLISTFSHELRTPLASIVAYAELLRDGAVFEGYDARMLQIIERNAHRLADLVEDVLTLSRTNTGMMTTELRPLNVVRLVESTCDALQPSVEQAELTLTQDHDRDDVIVMADASQFERLCFNLLTNAIKFTLPRGRVDVTTTVEGDSFILEVADTGIGIDDVERERIFERFYRGSAATLEAIPGSGVGLAIAEVIVRHHRGTIDVRDRDTRGTVFSVRLPLAPIFDEALP